MKNVIVAIALLAGSVAFAQGGTQAPASAPAATQASKPAKVNKKAARVECLKENATLKGAELKKCVKSKTL